MGARFSERTRRLLEISGWSEGRRVLLDQELPPGSAAGPFLEEFGALVVDVPRGGLVVPCRFDLVKHPVRDVYPRRDDELWQALTALSGSPLTPVGEQGGSILLLMSHEGRVFSVDDLWSFVGVIGQTPDEALEHLFAPELVLRGYTIEDDGSLTWESRDQ